MQFYDEHQAEQLTQDHLWFKRVYQTLVNHGVLVLPADTTLSESDFQRIYDAIDDKNKSKQYLRSILELVQYYQLSNWDGTIHSVPEMQTSTVFGLHEAKLMQFTNNGSASRETCLWYNIDQAELIDQNKTQREKNIFPIHMPIDDLWMNCFALPLQYLSIKKIDIIDRYSLQNAITQSSPKNHLIELLSKVNTSFEAKKQKASITLYSSMVNNRQHPEKSVTVEKINTFKSTLQQSLASFPAIHRIKLVVCEDKVFIPYGHERYMIFSTGLDELSYVYVMGRGIEIFGHDKLSTQTDIAVRVRKRADIDEYTNIIGTMLKKNVRTDEIYHHDPDS
jgi:hypothetical protein